ncbi:MAG: aminotransferase class V-fold PLP-dependent enzyme [Gammaproteobacteria bacterium]
MPGLLPNVDPDGLLEYSVVYTDRALNHMSQSFQQVMRDSSAMLKEVYQAEGVAIVPGSGTFGMEAAARQFGTGKKCLVIRNGWFSFRWTQIFEMGKIPSESIVLKARQAKDEAQAPFAPCPIEEVVETIKSWKPAVVFAPHVETSSGMILPDGYIKAMADAVHEVGGMLVIDCIASGTIWLDMKKLGIDVLISAPQKGWSATPCCGLVMLSALGIERTRTSTSTSFACDLGKWLQIMEAYEKGGHAYHATMPTDGIRMFRDMMLEAKRSGFAQLKQRQQELGDKVRALLESKGFPSVAAEGFKAPGVVVSYTSDADFQNGRKFLAEGLQIAAGVPLQCDEREDFRTFRIGLFGIDKLQNVDRTVATFGTALNKLA